jgi:hypothetical protein
MPLSEINPIACFVGNNEVTVASKGATTFPSVGSIATPLPNEPRAKAESSISDKGLIFPAIGALIISFSKETFLFFFYYLAQLLNYLSIRNRSIQNLLPLILLYI